jgi:hypothetical protein
MCFELSFYKATACIPNIAPNKEIDCLSNFGMKRQIKKNKMVKNWNRKTAIQITFL